MSKPLVRWSWVVGTGVVFLSLMAVNEISGTNWGWYLALIILAGMFLTRSGDAAGDITNTVAGTLNRLSRRITGNP